jgi:peptidoglycan/xylan/chitin deacetylase (PgdA/CDA1 family)
MRVCVTVDMEQDCPPYLSTWRGIDEGTPRLLGLLAAEEVPATFFTTGEVARRSPATVREIVERGHELGCHGDLHRRFDSLDREDARQEIANSTRTLRDFTHVTSFRAPNLAFPNEYLPLLEEADYRLDSSQARYKTRCAKIARVGTLLRVPASVTSSLLRLPWVLRRLIFSRLADPVVLFVHPWEFVDFTRTSLRLDCRFRTGPAALRCLAEAIGFFKNRDAQFVKIEQLEASA